MKKLMISVLMVGIMLSGCQQKCATTKKKAITSEATVTNDFHLADNYHEDLLGKYVQMHITSCDYDQTQKAFVIYAQLQNRTKETVQVTSSYALVHGYQIPIKAEHNQVKAGKRAQASFLIYEKALKKANVTFGGASMTFRVIKGAQVLEKETVGLPLPKFHHADQSSCTYVGNNQSEKRINRLFVNKKGLKVSLDYCCQNDAVDRIYLRVMNTTSHNLQVVMTSLKAANGAVSVKAPVQIVEAGNSMICEYHAPATLGDLKANITFYDNSHHRVFMKTTLTIKQRDFKSI